MVEDVSPKPPEPPEYLGDGAYVRFDGYQLWVFTTDGTRTLASIALDRDVFYALTRYAKRFSFEVAK